MFDDKQVIRTYLIDVYIIYVLLMNQNYKIFFNEPINFFDCVEK